jgi:UDP-N-acetylmuramoyl-L-alanyl-D-glutamate--2,6-diaminopimelate ligase
MRLKELLSGIAACEPGREDFLEKDIPAVWDDSRRVTPGSLFAALPGPRQDGLVFLEAALNAGAQAVVLSRDAAAGIKGKHPQACFIPVDDPARVFRAIAGRFYGYPSRRVKAIGITGTNGKTTISYILESILKAAGFTSGVIGTVNSRVGEEIFPSRNTTPGFLDNQIFFADLVRRKVPYAVMEVSSHALDQGRVDLIDFNGAVFTNLTGDHLDYHKTMDAYFNAKARLFTTLSQKAYAVINADDPWGRKLKYLSQARVFSFAIDSEAHVRAVSVRCGLEGSSFHIVYPGGKIAVKSILTGKHNVYNILAAFAAGLGEGLDPMVMRYGIEALMNVPGRLERVACDRGFYVFIDYAHTDDGLRNVLGALKQVRHRRLIVVFGAGGDRDRTKRPRMGRVACEMADHSILTSDNPRSEDPVSIIREIEGGFTKKTYDVIPDRREAIGRALSMAGKSDIVLLAGKGHETCQVLKDGPVDFVERDIVKGYFQSC